MKKLPCDNLPNFFIVGAPKSGTTALAHYLSQHPNCFFSERKELHYFCPSIEYHYRISDWQDYLSFFRDARQGDAIGEGSVWYLYSPDAAHKIYSCVPEAKIIIMLRNPADMLESLHQQYVWNGYEPISELQSALTAHNDRMNGKNRPNKSIMNKKYAPAGLVYWEACFYALQVRRFLDKFGPDAVKIVKYDDFKADTQRTFTETCQFLGIDHSFIPSFEIVNQRKSIRSRKLEHLMQRPPRAVRTLRRLRAAQALRKKIQEANRTKPRRQMTPELRDWVLKFYTDDISELQEITALDLSDWLPEI